MTYKTICSVISDQDVDAVALDAAISLAAANDGHIDILCLGVDPVRYDLSPLGSTAALTLSMAGEAHKRAAELEAWAKEYMRASNVAYSVRPLVALSGGVEAAVAREARYSDVLIAAQPYGEGTTQLQVSILEAALFGTGVPVLVIPAKGLSADGFRRVMVAWNESDEALSAVRKTIPLLQAAEAVSIVMVDPPVQSHERSDPGGAISQLLSRHGIHADVVVLSQTMPRVSDVLNRFARENAEDLIVMGAYGHSRFREALMGGATRDMLEEAGQPVLMAH